MARAVRTPLDLVELAAAPATPPSGAVRLYGKTDGKVYRKDDGGVEAELGGGGGAAAARTTVTYTTASLAPNVSEQGVVAMAKAYKLLRVSVNRPARVRLYTTITKRNTDASRGPVGASVPHTRRVEVNLGANPRRGGRFTITDALIAASGQLVMVNKAPGPYTGKGTRADEAEMDVVVCSAVPGAGAATVYWTAESPVKGNFKFDYLIGYTAPGTDPSGDHGLVLDFVATATLLAADLSPVVDGANLDSVPSASIPIAVENRDAASGSVAVTFTYIPVES